MFTLAKDIQYNFRLSDFSLERYFAWAIFRLSDISPERFFAWAIFRLSDFSPERFFAWAIFRLIYVENFVCSYEKVSYVGYISDLGRDPTIAKTVLESLIQ